MKKLQVSIIKKLMLNDELVLVNIASKLIQNNIDQKYFFGYVVVSQGESEGYNFASSTTKYHLSEYLNPRCGCKFCYLLFKEGIIFFFVTNITFTGSAMVNWNRRLLIQGVTTVIMVNIRALDPMRIVRQGSS